MTFRNDCPEMESLIDALEQAAGRGVSVSVLADTLTYTELRGSLFSLGQHQRRGLEALRLERRLKRAGVVFQWLGRDAGVGFVGRTHCKWAVIDETVFAFGGINLDAVSFTNTDYMLQFRHPSLAETLLDEHFDLSVSDKSRVAMRNRLHEDVIDDGSVLIDGGIPLNSQIYQRACELAKDADRITVVSQYCPTGKLMRLIKKCPHHHLYFNHLRNATVLNSLILGLSFINHQYNSYQRSPYLHAKFILYQLHDGERVALLGSHNFVRGTGLAGTREIALETRDSRIITLLEQFLREHVA